MTIDPIVLVSTHGAWQTRVTLDPALGGAIVAYASSTANTQLDWLKSGPAGSPVSFPMVPFCSRVREGRFNFGGHEVALAANNPPESHAIHGHGFQRSWQVDVVWEHGAELSYEYAGGAWPWPYAARLELQLARASLSVRLSLENRAADVMPCGLGLHPYFPLSGSASVQALVAKRLRLDDVGLPVDVAQVPAELDLSAGLKMDGLNLDHVFLGWKGPVDITWDEPRRGLRLYAGDVCEYLVLYSPSDAPYFCVEPVTNLPDGFNLALRDWPAFQTLAPGQTLSTEFRFEPYGPDF